MKRNFIALTTIVLAIAFIPSCQKGDEYMINQGQAEVKGCPIVQIIRNDFGVIDTVVFAYNNWNDPVRITKLPRPYMGTYSGPNYAFAYDKKHRLIEITAFDSSAVSATRYYSRYKYFYDNPGNGNITRDSGYYYGCGGPVFYACFKDATYYTYDKYDRIIKDSLTANYEPGSKVNTYYYNGKGNMDSVGVNHFGLTYATVFSTYDNKTNILRTNKIWMFLSRNYSVNNSFVAESYNSKGLPTRLNLFDKGSYLGNSLLKLCFDTYYDEEQITYGCK